MEPLMRCRHCHLMDLGLMAAFCDTHKRGRINYDTPIERRTVILAMCAATGAELRVERDKKPEILL